MRYLIKNKTQINEIINSPRVNLYFYIQYNGTYILKILEHAKIATTTSPLVTPLLMLNI